MQTASTFLEGLREKDKSLNEKYFLSLTDNVGQSCVHLASQLGHHHFLKLITEAGAELDGGERSGETGLHLAAREADQDHLECLSVLLEGGADPGVTDHLGRTPLHLAVSLNQTEAVRRLLSGGADTKCRDSEGDLDTAGRSLTLLLFTGNNILHLLSHTGPHHLARILPVEGQDLDQFNKEGFTPLHLAIINKQHQLVSLFLSQGPDLTLLTKEGRTYLELSLIHFSPDICRGLLEVWPDQLELYQQETGETWLHYTAKNGMVEQAELLLQFGRHVEARDANLQSPLHYAVLFNQVRRKDKKWFITLILFCRPKWSIFSCRETPILSLKTRMEGKLWTLLNTEVRNELHIMSVRFHSIIFRLQEDRGNSLALQ